MEMSHRDGAVRGAGGWHVRLGAIPAYRGLAHAGGSFAARRHHARAGRRVSSASRALAMDAVQRRRLRGHARAALVAAAGGQQGVITRPAETAAIPRHVLAHWTEQAGSARGQSRQQERTRAPQQKRRAFCAKRCGFDEVRCEERRPSIQSNPCQMRAARAATSATVDTAIIASNCTARIVSAIGRAVLPPRRI